MLDQHQQFDRRKRRDEVQTLDFIEQSVRLDIRKHHLVVLVANNALKRLDVHRCFQDLQVHQHRLHHLEVVEEKVRR